MMMREDWPTLTELFFGKGNGPQGPLNTETGEREMIDFTKDSEYIKLMAGESEATQDTNQEAQDEILVSTGKTEESEAVVKTKAKQEDLSKGTE